MGAVMNLCCRRKKLDIVDKEPKPATLADYKKRPHRLGDVLGYWEKKLPKQKQCLINFDTKKFKTWSELN